MVRKVSVIICAIALIFAFGMTAQGASYDVYDEGNPSTTYVQYFRDIVAGMDFGDSYVAFRSGQYEYVLCVGDLSYSNGTISLDGVGGVYTFTQTGSYNSTHKMTYSETDNFTVYADGSIVYSDLGHFPRLVERGAQYEIVTAVLVAVALLGIVIGRIFRVR